MTHQELQTGVIWWPSGPHRYDQQELVADAVVHCMGIMVAILLGGGTLVYASFVTAPDHAGSLAIYLTAMIAVLTASLCFNQCPLIPLRKVLGRIDQAAIFVFIAATYTPILTLLGSGVADWMLPTVWLMAIVGASLKIGMNDRFGRIAIPIYLALGWGGLVVAGEIIEELPSATIWLLLAGGISYSVGVFFHLCEAMRFHNVIWHASVVTGMILHLLAIADCMVFSKL